MSQKELSRSDEPITGAAEIMISDRITILTNDEQKNLPIDSENKKDKSDSYSSEEEEEKINQNTNENNNVNPENQNVTNNNENNENNNNDIQENTNDTNDTTAEKGNNDTNIDKSDNNENKDNEENVNNENKDNEKENDNNENNSKETENDNNDNENKETENDNKDDADNNGNEESKEQIPSATFLTETSEAQLIKANDSNAKNIAQPQPIDQAELEAALNSFLEKKTLPPSEYTEPMIQLINHKRMDCLEESDYNGAEDLDAALDLLVQKSIEENDQKAVNFQTQKINDRVTSLKDRIDEINNRYDNKIQTLQDNFESKFQCLVSAQAKQTQEFKEKWQNPEFLRQFDRPSQSLISIMSLEKKMGLSGRYKDAKNAKLQADRIKQREEKEAQQQMEEVMKTEFLKLRAQQQDEVNKMVFRNDAMIEVIENQRKREIDPLNIALRQVELKMKSRSNVNAKNNAHIAIPKTKKGSPLARKKSPRTAQRVVMYRNNRQTDFAIAPIDDQQFQRLTAMTNRQKARAKSTLAKKSLPPL